MPRKLKGKWAVYHDKCRNCGTTEHRHYAHGLCVKCWNQVRYEVDHERMKQHLRNSYYRRKYGKTEEEYKREQKEKQQSEKNRSQGNSQ